MLLMLNNKISPDQILKQLGQRLKEARLDRNESQELFSQRLGLTRQTYSQMEKGSPKTPIKHWLEACSVLGMLEGWQNLLTKNHSLFVEFENKSQKRQRASRIRK